LPETSCWDIARSSPHHSCQHVPSTTGCHTGIASGVDPTSALWRSDQRAMPFQHDDHLTLGGKFARHLDAIGLNVATSAGQPGHFAGWGVMTALPTLASFSLAPSNALRPSASRTIGRCSERPARRTNSAVSGLREIPGPIASTDFPSTIASRRLIPGSSTKLFRLQCPPKLRSSTPDKTPRPLQHRLCGRDRGEPSPTRSAANPANAAAPALPSDPPITRRGHNFPLFDSRGRGASNSQIRGRAEMQIKF